MKEKLLALKLPGQDQPIQDPLSLEDQLGLSDIINFGISALFFIGIIVTLVFLIRGGIIWITSGGDKEKLDKARKTIIYAIIGIIVILLSFVIVSTVGSIMGISIFPFTRTD